MEKTLSGIEVFAQLSGQVFGTFSEDSSSRASSRKNLCVNLRVVSAENRDSESMLVLKIEIRSMLCQAHERCRGHLQGMRPIAGEPNTCVPSSSQMPGQHTSPTSLRGLSPSPGYRNTIDHNASQMKGVFVPTSSPFDGSSGSRSQTSAMIGDGGELHNDPLLGGCIDSINNRQVVDMPTATILYARDFAGTPYIPVYVMLPLGVVNMKCELVDPDGLLKQLKILKSINVDGVMVDCWWGVVEAHAPQEYNWSGHKRLFQIVRELKMKLQGSWF